MELLARARRHVYALLGYGAVALAFTWPLATHLSTHLTGRPSEDTGLYVWNQWVFHYELIEHRGLPYLTDRIFSDTGPANLSLHNYTVFQDLVALPLIEWLGVVTTFNLVYLLMTVLTAYFAFLLAKHVTGCVAESWIAGVLFAWSPVIVTWSTGHFSLVAAAPLALFLLLLVRSATHERLRDAAALGAAVAWAASTDLYYPVYCLIIAAVVLLPRMVRVERRAPAPDRAVPKALDVALLCIAGLIVSILVSGGWEFEVLDQAVHVKTLYTPMLILTVLVILRIAWPYKASLLPFEDRNIRRAAGLTSLTALVAAVLLSPLLYAIGLRVFDGRWDPQRVFWRSSPSGIDLMALVLPNPNHPLAPEALRAWLGSNADSYQENVASVSFVAIATLLVAWRAGWRVPRMWAWLAVVFGALALGPFVHISGMNTYVPGPWALLRYVPIIGLARMPARLKVVLMLAIAVLFASALAWLGHRWPQRRRLLLSAIAAVLMVELLPAPRTLYSATVPRIYRPIAEAASDYRVLQLPFGVRDGMSLIGNYSALWQYFQTAHGKPLVGGQLSRVSKRQVTEIRKHVVLDALITLSEGRRLGAAREWDAFQQGPNFVRKWHIGFVVIDRQQTSDALRLFAIDSFHLQLVDSDGTFELYRPSAIPQAGKSRKRRFEDR